MRMILLYHYSLILSISAVIYKIDQFTSVTRIVTNWNNQNLLLGSYSKYTPFNNFEGQVFNSEANLQLIYAGLDLEDQNVRLLHFVEFNEQNKQIKHVIKIITLSNTIQEEFLIDHKNYEGLWISQYMYFDQQQLIIGIKQKNGFQEKSISTDYFTNNQFLLIIGSGLKIFDSFIDQTLLLGSFQGNTNFFLEEDFSILNEVSFFEKCVPLTNNTISDYFTYKIDSYKKFQIEKDYMDSFYLQFWVKILSKEELKNTILRLSINKSSNIIGSIGSNSGWTYYIEYYSYDFPFIKEATNDAYKQFFQDSISIEFITDWHLIKVEYLEKQLMIQLESFILEEQKIKYFKNVNQFTNTKMILYFGGNQQEKSQNSGEIGSVIFKNCLDQNQQVQYCHYSCKTCFGPFKSQCLSCFDQQNRIFDPQKHSCNCKLWHYENKNDNYCIGNEQNQYIEIKEYLNNDPMYDENDNQKTCAFGYFSYKDECIQCPSASQKGYVQCVECLMNPDTWVYDGICGDVYMPSKNIENGVYNDVFGFSGYFQPYYILIDYELNSCGGCLSCTEDYYLQGYSRCFVYPFKHLDKILYIECRSGYNDQLYKCNERPPLPPRKPCDQYCQSCSYDGCNYCKSTTKYFMTWQNICRECLIQNCKYCFQYNRFDHSQVSAIANVAGILLSQNEEDYIIACSLCNSGYVFDFQINQCIQKQIPLPCLTGFINQDLEFVCTNYQGTFNQQENNQVAQFHDCQKYFSNCKSCIQDSFKMIYCISCFDGYYLQYKNGLCISCSTLFSNAKTCSIETSTHDSWKYDVVSFYLNFIRDSSPIQLSGLYYQTYYFLNECQEGYIPYNTKCISEIDNQCIIWDSNYNFCVKCRNLYEEYDAQSYFDNKCQICPYPCRVCTPISQTQINSINPYFIYNELTKIQTHRCFLNQIQDQAFIHQLSGQLLPKDAKNQKYLLKIQRSNFPDATISNVQNYIDFEYLKKRKVTTYIDNYNAFRQEDPINLREILFFIFNSTVLYDGFNDTYHEKQISITNQTTVNVQNVRFFSQKNSFTISSYYGLNIYINNITLSSFQRQTPIFQITNFTQIYISKIEIDELTLINTSLFILKKNYDLNKSFQIIIEEISFKNCTFYNSSFLQLQTKLKYIEQFQIKKIILNNCSITNSEFFKFQSQSTVANQFVLVNLEIKNSNFTNSQFLSLQNSNFVIIAGIMIQNCLLNQTILISLNHNSLLQNIHFINIIVDYSQFFIFLQSLNQKSIHKIDGIFMENIFVCSENLIKIQQDLQENSTIELKNIKLNQIQFNSNYLNNEEEKLAICLFNLQSYKIDILLLKNDQINFFWIFCIDYSNIINIEEIEINSFQQLQYNLVDNYSKPYFNLLNAGFIQLKKIQKATFSNILIKCQNLIDSSMIYINTRIEQQLKDQQIIFSNISFENNFLVKLQSFSITTLLYLESEDRCNILITNITFISNYAVHQIFDSFTISSSMICIMTQYLTQIKNAQFYENQFYNSSFPALYIKSQYIQIEQMNSQDTQEFDLTKQGFETHYFENGGFSNLFASQIIIIDSKFINSQAQEAEYLYIILYNQGYLQINNTSFINIIVSSKENSNSSRAVIVVDAASSNMNFEMNNILVSNIISKHSSGFLKIISSKIKNLLKLNNLIVKNVLSKQNTFLDIECTNQADNLVDIADFQMKLEKDFFFKYQYFIGFSQNSNQQSQGMLFITNSSIIFFNLHFSGFAPMTILNLLDNFKILVNSLVLEQIEVATKNLNIIKQEDQSNQIRLTDIYLSQFTIKNLFNELDFNVESFFEIIHTLPKRLILKDIFILNNTCQACQKGLILIEQFEKLIINNLIIYQNQCGQQTCLILNKIDQSFIQQSKFIRNTGTQGGVINIKSNKVQMKNIEFILNQAENGGAIFQQLFIKQETIISNLYLIQNRAKIGGAIYSENHSFEFKDLINMYFLENKGEMYINNIKENPSQLRISIFDQELETKSKQNIGTPNFEKYKTQNNIIYIPSGQQINNYSIQNLENQTFLEYNLNPKLYGTNNLGEKQINLQNYQCLLQQINKLGKIIPSEDQIIPYDIESQSFDFSSLIIRLDPYSKDDITFLFDCNCFSESKYKFLINVKSFPCQLGEFYYFNQCMKCDESKGFYSVETKATFCQKIDPKIIKSNTANEIELQPGYWRPNYRNKFINKCSKQKILCLGGWKPGDKSCSLGYIGALCEECDIYNIKGDGQFYKNQNNKCVYCSNFGVSIVISLIFGLLTIGSMILTVSSVNTIFKSFLKFKLTSKYYKILFNHSLDQSAALIKTVVNYFQILVTIKSFQLELYFNFNDILTPLSNPIGTTSYSYECFLSKQANMQIIYISLIINILAPIFFYSIFSTMYLLLIYKKKLKLTPTIYATAILYLFFYAQPNIILELGELITLRNISEINYINRNVSILYFTSTHISWVLFFITPVLLIIGIIIPIILFLILYNKKNHFNQEKVRKIWGYIFNDYKESSFYWEIIRVSEREIILLSLIVFEEQIEIKGILTFLILFLYHIIVQIKKPFHMDSLNRFEQKCISISSLIFLICGIKYQIQQQQIIQIDYILQTLLLLVFIYFFWILITQTIQTYYQKYSDRLDGIRKIVITRSPKIIKLCPFLKTYLKLRVDTKIKMKDRVKLIKESLLMSKAQNVQNSYHWNLNSFSVQKSIYHEEQASNFINVQKGQKEQTHLVKDLVKFN